MTVPIREGVTGKILPKADPHRYQQLPFSRGTRLADLEKEYVFFTVGLLFSHGGWVSDPVADFIQETNPSALPFQLNLPSPIFEGLEIDGQPDWNYRILLCPRPTWDGGLFRFLSMLGGVNQAQWYYHRMLAQALPVTDVLAVERNPELLKTAKQVTVIAFGIDSNKGMVAFEPKLDLFGLYRPVVKPPDEQTVAIASSFLKEESKPFKAAEQLEKPT